MLEIGDIRQIKCRIKANDKERQDILKRCQEKKLFITPSNGIDNLLYFENVGFVENIEISENNIAFISFRVLSNDLGFQEYFLKGLMLAIFPIYICNEFSYLEANSSFGSIQFKEIEDKIEEVFQNSNKQFDESIIDELEFDPDSSFFH